MPTFENVMEINSRSLPWIAYHEQLLLGEAVLRVSTNQLPERVFLLRCWRDFRCDILLHFRYMFCHGSEVKSLSAM